MNFGVKKYPATVHVQYADKDDVITLTTHADTVSKAEILFKYLLRQGNMTGGWYGVPKEDFDIDRLYRVVLNFKHGVDGSFELRSTHYNLDDAKAALGYLYRCFNDLIRTSHLEKLTPFGGWETNFDHIPKE